ncbi:MAG: alpha-amylase family glycosyl hydrolase [Promethearchaeia archaeon]
MTIQSEHWPLHPLIYEINTITWLNELSNSFDYEINLQNVPEGILDMDLSHFDAIWLMGVWERSPEGKDIARNHPNLQKEFQQALDDFKPTDVAGSPYAVYYYHVATELGGKTGVQMFKDELAKRGARLILDYVPNHVARDHLWTLEKNSNVFIKGTQKDLEENPDDFFSIGNKIYAHGRDPYFPPWTDTIQINAFSKEARKKAINTLLSIAELCDGVRCDMAMLMINKVFKKTWGEKVGEPPEKEFWEEVIPAVKKEHPDFKFFGEAYWGTEWELQQQGFDFCYDKILYERLLHDNAPSVKGHLRAEWEYQRSLVRFIENHDEERAISAFGYEKSKAAAIISCTLPGARMIHYGQMLGRKIRTPIQLARAPKEEDDQDLMEFYLRLINSIPDRNLRENSWHMCETQSINSDNDSNKSLISYIWAQGSEYKLIIVNYSSYPAQGHILLPDLDPSKEWTFSDSLKQDVYTYKGGKIRENGLYVELGAWEGHIFKINEKLKESR